MTTDTERPDVAALLTEIRDLVALQAQLLFTEAEAARLCRLGKTRFHELVLDGTIPPGVNIPGFADRRCRRADLDAWAAKLKTRRNKPQQVIEPIEA